MIEPNELYHHGVKGMKWGVRKDKQKYGMSKREVKRAVKQAKRNYRKNEDPKHLFNGITGKNWAKVRSENKKAVDNDSLIKDYKTKRDYAYSKATFNNWAKYEYLNDGKIQNQHAYDYHSKEAERYQIQGDTYNQLALERTSKIGTRYTQQYNDALLKDIGYKGNIETGREMLAKYKINNNYGKYS